MEQVQHFGRRYNILKHVTTFWNTLQHFGTHYNILKHVTKFWNTLQHLEYFRTVWNTLEQCVTTNMLKQLSIGLDWNTLQQLESRYTSLNHVTTAWNTSKQFGTR